MRLLNDYVLVEVPSLYDNVKKIKGTDGYIDLEISAKNYEEVTEASKRRRSGKVVSVCRSLSKDAPRIEYARNNGFPAPMPTQINTEDGVEYLCGLHEDEYVYKNRIQVQDGDYVYFTYLSLNESSLMEKKGDKEVHKIPYRNIFAFVRAEELHVVDGFALLNPIYDEKVVEVEHDGVSQRMLVSDSGIVIDHNPKPKVRSGVLVKKGRGIGFNHRDEAKVGDTIFIGINKNKLYVVEGKEYYVLSLHNMIGCMREGDLVPYGNYVKVCPNKQEKGTVELLGKYMNAKTSGKVISWGEGCIGGFDKGDVVHFVNKTSLSYYHKDTNELLISEDYVYAVGDAKVEILEKRWKHLN